MNLIPERVLTRAFPRTFRFALLEKDIGIAAELARDNRVPVAADWRSRPRSFASRAASWAKLPTTWRS